MERLQTTERRSNLLRRLVIALLGLGAAFMPARVVLNSAPTRAEEPQIRTAAIQRGDVVSSVTASGTLQPLTTVDVKSNVGGRVDVLAVDVGDEVKKGALIAKIDPTDTVTQFEQARADYQASNARLQQAVANLQIQKDATEAEIQQAEQELALTRARELQARLQMKAQPSLSDAAIAQAEADLKASQDELEQLQVATIPQEKAEARASYDQAVADRENARKEYERQQALLARGFVAASTVDTATMRLKNAEASVRTAKARLDTIDQEHQARLHSARAAVEQAKAVLDAARTGYRMP